MHLNFAGVTLAAALGAITIAEPASAQFRPVAVAATVDSLDESQSGPRSSYPQAWQRGYAQYPERRYPAPNRGRYVRDDYALSNGYRDGYEKGFDDGRDRNRFDPRRHRKYRNGDSGYRRDYYGRRDEYRDSYRRGFTNGYDAGYRAAQGGYARPDRRGPYPPNRRDQRPGWGFWFRK